MRLIAATVATDTDVVVKMALIQDKQTNKATFATTDLLEADLIASYNNLANKSRFRTLKTWITELNVDGGTPSGAALVFAAKTLWVEHYIKCDIPIEYDNSLTTGVVSTQTSSSIWLTFQISSAEIALSVIQVRLRFVDI